MFKVLRGRIQLYFFLLKYHRAYLVSLIVTVIGVVGMVVGISIPNLGSLLTLASILGIISTLVGVLMFIRDALTIRKAQNDLYSSNQPVDSENPALALALSDTYAGYEKIWFGPKSAIFSTDVNRMLRSNPIPLRVDGQMFQMPGAAWQVAPLALRRVFESRAYVFNSQKPRLTYDPTPSALAAGTPARLQRTDYFTELCTNEMVGQRIGSNSNSSIAFNGAELMANNRTLLDLADSGCGCANLMGISTVAFTRDGYLIITVQGAHAQQNAGNLAPSGSGSIDLNDMRPGDKTLQDVVRRATERELREECGLLNSDHAIRTELIGFCRLIHRGGLPEFFSVSVIDIDHNTLHIPSSELPYIGHIDRMRMSLDSEAVKAEVTHYLASASHRSFSEQLQLNLRFLIDYLNDPGDSFKKLVTG